MFQNMRSFRITKIVQSDPRMRRIFYGIYSADALREAARALMQRTTPIAFLIVNSRPAAVQSGGHWLGFCLLQERRELLFLDSFGRSPQSYGGAIATFRSLYFPNFHLVSPVTRPLQSASSLLCGLYVLYWLKKLAHGASPASLLAAFIHGRGDRTENDRFLIRWARLHIFKSEPARNE